MPKTAKKYYAVAVGRDAPNIYMTWDKCREQVTRYPGALHKSFPSLQQAEQWLANKVDLDVDTCTTSATCFESTSTTSTPPRSRPFLSQNNDNIPRPTPPFRDSSPLPLQHELGIHTHRGNLEECLSSPLQRDRVSLSREQEWVLERVKQGRSVFFTGSAGTGKSVLLRHIIETLQERGSLGITASTGIAAVNIGGSTLHSWAGIGLGDEPYKKYVGKFFAHSRFEQILGRWKNVKTLIIDEVSMIDGTLFDKLENMARELRHNNAPFGGIQLILSGDFCQLPPVPGRGKEGQQIPPVFAFDAKTWDACVGRPVMLTHVFRQKDQTFIDMLNAMRFGGMNAQIIATFSSLSRKVDYNDGIEPTELFSTRNEVNNSNAYRLGQLNTESHTYVAIDYPGVDSNDQSVSYQQMTRLLERLVVSHEIQLKVGAQVMLVKNLVQGRLVNGSVGQVIRFSTTQEALKEATRIASSERGDKQRLPQTDFTWPIVRFIDGQETMIIPQEFTVNNANGGIEARREQVPLILAWALSVHKSQGQTLERVKVDLKKTFEKGQAYVALSRATCLDQLQVLNFDASRVEAHPRVLQWHFDSRTLATVSEDVIDLTDFDDENTGC